MVVMVSETGSLKQAVSRWHHTCNTLSIMTNSKAIIANVISAVGTVADRDACADELVHAAFTDIVGSDYDLNPAAFDELETFALKAVMYVNNL